MVNDKKAITSSKHHNAHHQVEKDNDVQVIAKEENHSLKRDEKRKREEIKNSTIGGF